MAKAYVFNEEFIPVVAQRLTQGNTHLNGLVWTDLRRIDYDVKNKLKSFNAPVLILHGADDIVDLKLAKEANNIYPNSKLVIIEKSRHYGWLDQKELYLKHISEFLKEKA